MEYKYKELDYAKQIYEHGFIFEKHRPTELRLLATYMRRVLDYKPKKLREELNKWCLIHIIGFRPELYYKMINRAIHSACKKGSTLINIENIDFHQYELDYLNHLHISGDYPYECKKLLFTLLFQIKINKQIMEVKNTKADLEYQGKYFKGGSRKYTELKKIAKLPDKLKINEDIIHCLWNSGLVTPMYNGLIQLNFMDEIRKMQEQETDLDKTIALQIKDFESVGWYFDYYHENKKIVFCKCCGKIFRKRSNKELYCSEECKKHMKNEKNKIYYQNKHSIQENRKPDNPLIYKAFFRFSIFYLMKKYFLGGKL